MRKVIAALLLAVAWSAAVAQDFTDTGNETTPFTLYAQCGGSSQMVAGISGFTATIETQEADASDGSALTGAVQYRVSFDVRDFANVPARVVAYPITQDCSNKAGTEVAGAKNMSFSLLQQPPGTQMSTQVYSGSVDYADLRAVQLVDANNASSVLACCNLYWPFPKFPQDVWSTVVEVNIVNKNYSFIQYEYYNNTANRARFDFHSSRGHYVIIQAHDAQHYIFLRLPNETDASGECRVFPFSAGRGPGPATAEDGESIASTEAFLRFNLSAATYDSEGDVYTDVRGITCESWSYPLSGRNVNGSFGSSSAEYTVRFYFPIRDWNVARENYASNMKRVYLNGTRNGQHIEHYYEYIDFKPKIPPGISFEPCDILPNGRNCNCSRAQIEAYNMLVNTDGNGAALSSDFDQHQGCGGGYHGSQSGIYFGFFLFGFVLSALLTALACWLWYRTKGAPANHSTRGVEMQKDIPASGHHMSDQAVPL